MFELNKFCKQEKQTLGFASVIVSSEGSLLDLVKLRKTNKNQQSYEDSYLKLRRVVCMFFIGKV